MSRQHPVEQSSVTYETRFCHVEPVGIDACICLRLYVYSRIVSIDELVSVTYLAKVATSSTTTIFYRRRFLTRLF